MLLCVFHLLILFNVLLPFMKKTSIGLTKHENLICMYIYINKLDVQFGIRCNQHLLSHRSHLYIISYSCWHPLLEALSLLFNMGDVLNHIKGCVTTLYTEKCSCFIVKD